MGLYGFHMALYWFHMTTIVGQHWLLFWNLSSIKSRFYTYQQVRGDALDIYNRLISDFPASEHCDEAQFMVAFIYEEYLQDYSQAREAYELLIERYPDSELVASARHLLPHVGRNPEDWIHFETDDAEKGEEAK